MWKLIRRKRSFRALVGTQFLGAFNDNAFKELVALAVISTSTLIPWIKDHFLASEGGMGLVGMLFSPLGNGISTFLGQLDVLHVRHSNYSK